MQYRTTKPRAGVVRGGPSWIVEGGRLLPWRGKDFWVFYFEANDRFSHTL